MATENPFDIKTSQLGLIAGAAPQATAPQITPTAAPAAAQVGAQGPVSATSAQTQQAAQTRAGQASLATAQQAAVDPATQTVQGQLAGILASGSPLLVQAQTRAAQAANRRGLLNSSMAVGAGESALYDAAMPIASQDATTYSQFGLSNAERAQQAELANANAKNQMEQLNVSEEGNTNRFNVGETNTSNRFNTGETNTAARQTAAQEADRASQNAQLQQQSNLSAADRAAQTASQNAQLQQQTNLSNQDAQTKLMLQQMDATTRTELVNIEANYKTLMQASQSASDLYMQTLKNLSDITMNKDLSAAAKNAAMQQQKDLLLNGMNLIGSMNNLGIGELLNFGGTTGGGTTGGGTTNQTPAPAPTDENSGIQDILDRLWVTKGR